MSRLTDTQIETLRYCEEFLGDNGSLPTSGRVAEALGLSRQAASKRLASLERAGYLASREGGGWTLLRDHRGQEVKIVAAPVNMGRLTLAYVEANSTTTTPEEGEVDR